MAKFPVQPNDVFQKASGLTSKWLVERVIEFPDLPLHVRLNEQGGNERNSATTRGVVGFAGSASMAFGRIRRPVRRNDRLTGSNPIFLRPPFDKAGEFGLFFRENALRGKRFP